MVVSTPTGSTGYSLSAGGPIVSPEASLLLMTPVAPHTLNTRSIILPDDAEITVEMLPGHSRSGDGAEVTLTEILLRVLPDGQSRDPKGGEKDPADQD